MIHERNSNRVLHVAMMLFVLIVASYVALGGMWLDEMQVWCLARDSSSIPDLFHNMRNEGHPPLWHLLVWGVTCFTDDPRGMSAAHALFALGTAYIVLYRSHFPPVWRVLIIFGYFLLFEYTAIARNYGPGVFFLFVALDAHSRQRQWPMMIALIALAFTHYWGIVVAGSFALIQLFSPTPFNARRLNSVVVLGCAELALIVAIPSAQLGYKPTLSYLDPATLFNDLERIFGHVFIPFPDLGKTRSWDTNWLLNHWPHVHGIIGIACVAIAGWVLAKDRKWMLFFLLATLGVIAFPLLSPFGSIRYVGPVLLAFIGALWCARVPLNEPRKIAVFVLLALQVPGGIAMVYENLFTPRSRADTTVAYIAISDYADLPLVVHPFQLAPAISGYANTPVWNLSTDSLETFCRWDSGPFRLEDAALEPALVWVPYTKYLLITDGTDVVSLSSESMRIIQIANFDGAMIESEEHYVYVVERP